MIGSQSDTTACYCNEKVGEEVVVEGGWMDRSILLHTEHRERDANRLSVVSF